MLSGTLKTSSNGELVFQCVDADLYALADYADPKLLVGAVVITEEGSLEVVGIGNTFTAWSSAAKKKIDHRYLYVKKTRARKTTVEQAVARNTERAERDAKRRAELKALGPARLGDDAPIGWRG